jgi:hypothetical protein
VQRICTRSVNELVKALGMGRISMSQVSRLCAEIDVRVSAFLGRPIEGDWPYLWIVKVREAGRIVSVAAIVAVGVNTHGRREVLGRPGAGLRQSVLGTRCAGSHVPASARPGRRRTSPRLRAPSVAQRRSPIIAQEIGIEVLKRDPVHGHRGVRSVLVQVRQPDPIGDPR